MNVKDLIEKLAEEGRGAMKSEFYSNVVLIHNFTESNLF